MIHESGEKPESVIGHHTPGPWTVETPMGDADPWIVEANKQTHEWHCLAIIPADGGEDEVPTDEAMANARLMAAAPKLLAALQALVTEIRTVPVGDYPSATAMHEADAAIAKATGAP